MPLASAQQQQWNYDNSSNWTSTSKNIGNTTTTENRQHSVSDQITSIGNNAANGAYNIQTITAGLATKSESFSSDNTSIMSVTTAYDTLNRPITQTHSRTGAVTTTYQSDVSDTVVSTTDAGNRTTAVTYDLRGRQLSVNAPDTLDKDGNPLTNITITSYLANGRIGEQSGSQTYRKTYTYDYALRQHTLTTYQSEAANATGQTTTWNYDTTFGRLLNKRDASAADSNGGQALGKGCDYTYTPAGRLKTKTLARGAVITYTFDPAGRNTLISYSDTTPSVATIYDRLSRPIKVDQGAGTNLHEFTYNAITLAQLTEKITYGANTATPFIRTLNRAQDNLLRASSITLMAGTTTEHQINYGFDTAGRLSTITAADPNGGAAKVHTYGYLANSGNLIETITSPAHKVVNTYEADRNGLLSKQNSKLDNTLIGSYQYAMNSLGQRTSITKNGLAYPAANVETIGYDSKGQVVKTTDNTTATNNRLYTFDAIGNRLTDNLNTYTVNSVNEIQSILKNSDNSVINTTHDDDGNMFTGTLPEDATGATLVWDAQNRLTKITKNDNTVIEYTYDYQSRRISKTVGTTKTSWIYNGWNPIAEYKKLATANWELATTRTWGQDINGGIQSAGGVGGLLQETHHYPPLNSHYYPLYDGNGNITDYINTASAVLAHYQYDAFGNTIVKTGFKANDFAHRFSTKQRDAETGLYYYGYRYYDPVTGRWPSRDPIGEQGGVNLYGFVGNSVFNRWDALGLCPDKGVKRIIKIGFYGAGQKAGDIYSTLGSNGRPVFNTGWPLKLDSRNGVARFRSSHIAGAKRWLLKKLDENNDGVVDAKDSLADVRIVGFSWGGWSALQLSQWLNKTGKIKIKQHRAVSKLGLLDPVRSWRPGAAQLPNNVKTAKQIYQTTGCIGGKFTMNGVAVNFGSCFKLGGIVSNYRATKVNGIRDIKNVTGEGKLRYKKIPIIGRSKASFPDHLDMGYLDWGASGHGSGNQSYAEQIAKMLD